jgi:Arc/MetJ-type ribon-helix-helix transcriptional regulator
MGTKQRITVILDPELIAAGEQAVQRGQARSISAWIAGAVELQIAHQARLAAGAEYIQAFENDSGQLTEAQIEEANEWVRRTAVRTEPARGNKPKGLHRSRRTTR